MINLHKMFQKSILKYYFRLDEKSMRKKNKKKRKKVFTVCNCGKMKFIE